MHSISLLPSEIKQTREKNKKYFTIGTIIFIIALLCSGLLFFLFLHVDNVKNQVDSTKQNITIVESEIEELQKYRNSYKQITEITEVMEKTHGEVPNWQKTMIQIGETIPMKTWLNVLSMQYDDSVDNPLGILTIEAYTFDYKELTTWLKSLNNTDEINNIEYEFLKKIYDEDMDFAIYTYEIKAKVDTEDFTQRYLEEGESADD
ncbi:PilN domain-containing protein [Natranaerobius trueperi]|uniref:Fimbrial assembly protein n=1 Tax=Natranaerobius trueperi TaxID=759412 RepID=A0A226C2H8_9FIRM|nr:hypothetical protein [Natranaerobius trueperi]OWZ84639.1 hypothetical protein CDO51_02440 [Natranaerobius trueperi]